MNVQHCFMSLIIIFEFSKRYIHEILNWDKLKEKQIKNTNRDCLAIIIISNRSSTISFRIKFIFYFKIPRKKTILKFNWYDSLCSIISNCISFYSLSIS
jgi:hypothetical protein